MQGPGILVATMSVPRAFGKFTANSGMRLNYHPRSDHHSKVACWGIAFDLMLSCPLLREHVAADKVRFGINHEIRDYANNRKKDLDLVLCTPSSTDPDLTLTDLAAKYDVVLTDAQRSQLGHLPVMMRGPVGSVLVTLEAKACMTEFGKAGPRLYDELNSSQQIVHGSSNHTLAAGLALVNVSPEFFSPLRNKHLEYGGTVPEISHHQQPQDARRAISKVETLPRKSGTTPNGYDALGVVVIDCPNDGTEVRLVSDAPAPSEHSIFNYSQMIHRIAGEYATHFSSL